MRQFNEEDILDETFRGKIIKEIQGPENQQRKADSFKRWEIYKDRVKKYILEKLQQELDPETLIEVESRTSTINVFKKVVNKKSRIYKVSPNRKVIQEKGDDEQLQKLINCLNLDSEMKKVNRYTVAFKNCLVYVKPILDKDGYRYKIVVLAPHEFDVIEDPQDKTVPRVIILSEYDSDITYSNESASDRTGKGLRTNFRDGDNKDQVIADSPSDGDKTQFIWWSDNYHFTTNEAGMIEGEKQDIDNPIKRLPFVSFADCQDNDFWAVGGEDLIDGAMLVGMLLTDLYFIAKVQGMGLFYYFGKGAPKNFKVGPNKALTAEVAEGDPTPQVGFASANPPLDQHMAMIEQFLALLLTTNDLAVNAIAGQLNAATATSGIHEIIQNSEPVNALEDEQEQYKDKEPEILEIAARWQNVYLNTKEGLTPKFKDIGKMPDETSYVLSFPSPKPMLSEKEQAEIDNLKIAQGIKNKIDLMLDENPDLDRDQALGLLIEKTKENIALMREAMMENGFNNESTEDSENDQIEPQGDQEGE